MSARQQINIRADAELLKAVEDIRRMSNPIPTATEAIRDAIFKYRDLVARKEAKRK